MIIELWEKYKGKILKNGTIWIRAGRVVGRRSVASQDDGDARARAVTVRANRDELTDDDKPKCCTEQRGEPDIYSILSRRTFGSQFKVNPVKWTV